MIQNGQLCDLVGTPGVGPMGEGGPVLGAADGAPAEGVALQVAEAAQEQQRTEQKAAQQSEQQRTAVSDPSHTTMTTETNGAAATESGKATGDEPPSAKKKRGARGAGGEKANKGLRHFSMKVCEKVESKRRTSYNEVADELVQDFKNNEGEFECFTGYDEKNIRRRVYDALNVLMAMNIISKDKKEIHWKGLPTSTESSMEHLQGEKLRCASRIAKKKACLTELHEHKRALDALVARNAESEAAGRRSGDKDAEVTLPFILLQTRPTAVIEVEMSEDNMLMHFDFNETPFEVKDENLVLQELIAAKNGGNASTSAVDIGAPL